MGKWKYNVFTKNFDLIDQVTTILDNYPFQDSVLDKDLFVPPGSPTTGDRYIVGPSPTGLWATHEDDIAEWNATSWDFFVPEAGWFIRVLDEEKHYHYFATGWVPEYNLDPAYKLLVITA